MQGDAQQLIRQQEGYETSLSNFSTESASEEDKEKYRAKARYIEKISIINFGPVEKLTLDLSAPNASRIPCFALLGENGVGKSTVFDSIVQHLRTRHSECQNEFNHQFNQFTLIIEKLSRIDKSVQVSQIAYLQIQDALHSYLGMNESDLKQRHDELCAQAESNKRLSKELEKYDKYKKYVVIDDGLKKDGVYNTPANSIGSPYDK